MILNKDNYHTPEAGKHYMSNSQYKDFLACEARAMAMMDGWKEPQTDALLIGSYVHAYFEGPEAFEEFKANNPELISSRGPTKGELKTEFKKANNLIRAIESDPMCMFMLQGEKEVILTANFAGADWKIKIDCLNRDNNRFSDIKTTDSITKETWDKKLGYVSFVESKGYLTQMSLYAEIERLDAGRDGWIEPIIVAVSKEDPPDKAVVGLKAYDIERELDQIRENMPRILSVKSGSEAPNRCEKCRYCRETKQLTKITYYADLTL